MRKYSGLLANVTTASGRHYKRRHLNLVRALTMVNTGRNMIKRGQADDFQGASMGSFKFRHGLLQ